MIHISCITNAHIARNNLAEMKESIVIIVAKNWIEYLISL